MNKTFVVEIDFTEWDFGYAGGNEMREMGFDNGFQVHIGWIVLTFYVNNW